MIWWAIASGGVGIVNGAAYVSGYGGLFNATVAVLCVTLSWLLMVLAVDES